MALASDDKHLKLSLLNRLPYEGYQHLPLNQEQFQDLTFSQTLEKAQKPPYIEKVDTTSKSKTTERNVNNTLTDATRESTFIPSSIGGFKVNKRDKIQNQPNIIQ